MIKGFREVQRTLEITTASTGSMRSVRRKIADVDRQHMIGSWQDLNGTSPDPIGVQTEWMWSNCCCDICMAALLREFLAMGAGGGVLHGHVQVRLAGDPIPEVRLGAVEHHWVHNPIHDRPCPSAPAYSSVHVWATHGAHYRDCPRTFTRPIDMDVLSHLSPDDRIRMQRFMSGACSVDAWLAQSCCLLSSFLRFSATHAARV